MRSRAVPRPILHSVMRSAEKYSWRPLTVTSADPFGANGKSEPNVTFCPPVNAMRLGRVYMLPAQH